MALDNHLLLVGYEALSRAALVTRRRSTLLRVPFSPLSTVIQFPVSFASGFTANGMDFGRPGPSKFILRILIVPLPSSGFFLLHR